jgi:hypothetical protein
MRSVGRLLALVALVLSLIGCGGASSTGVLTGEIRFLGGLTRLPGTGPDSGRVIVFTTSGRIVARRRVDGATHLRYRIVLPPGDYGVNAGSLPQYDPPRNCRPQKVHVRPGRTTRVNVYQGCGEQ